MEVLTTTHTASFDDVEIEGRLHFSFNGPEPVLALENDAYYGSNFRSMIAVLDYLDSSDIEHFYNSLDLTRKPDMTDAELGFEDGLNDGSSWAEYPFNQPVFAQICSCHALHTICSHG